MRVIDKFSFKTLIAASACATFIFPSSSIAGETIKNRSKELLFEFEPTNNVIKNKSNYSNFFLSKNDDKGVKKATEKCKFSKALNLGVTKALKRPPTNNPLDSHVYIAGIKCKEKGSESNILKKDFLLQSGTIFDQLSDKGFDLVLTYFPDFTWTSFDKYNGLANINNNKKKIKNPLFTSEYIISMDLYTEKAGLWDGGQIHFTNAGFTGEDDVFAVPANQPVRAELSPLNDLRVFELWYGQKITPEFELRVGNIYPWVKLASHQSSGIFQNQIFDFPGLIGTTKDYGYWIPYGQTPFGLQALYNPNQHHQFIFHLADGKADPTGGMEPQIWDHGWINGDGVEIIAEYAYLSHSPNPKKLPGYYKIGFQANTGKFHDYKAGKTNDSGQLIYDNDEAIVAGYITLEKMIYAENSEPARSQGLIAFAKSVYSPSNKNVVKYAGTTGLAYSGLFPSRDRDVTGIGFAYTSINEYAADYFTNYANASWGLGLNDRESSKSESVIELVHQVQISPSIMLIGSYQYIINASPLGVNNNSDENGNVFLLNTRLAF